jgi:glycosyltransferase involved in cell wall biosynthesis
MRILFIAGSFPPQKCGVGDYTKLLAWALSKQVGVRVAVLADEEVAHARHDPQVEVFPVVKGWRVSDIPRVVKVLRKWKPDIVHIQYPTQGFYGRKILPYDLPLIVKCCGKKVVQTWHESAPWNRISIYVNGLVTSKIVVVKPEFTATMPRYFRLFIPSKEFRYIPNTSTIPRAMMTDAERSALRDRMVGNSRSLVVYLGFVYPHKGVEYLFQIADPELHHIVLISDLNSSDPYHRKILDLLHGSRWSGHATVTGFLPTKEAGELLCSADAAVFPFPNGAAIWNTSIHGAAAQGTFVLTTSREKRGYDEPGNIYYAAPGNYHEMRFALGRYIGRKNPNPPRYDWGEIASAHLDLYKQIMM